MTPAAPQAIALLQLTKRISAAIASAPELTNVWVVAETSDLRVAGGHCYMELIEKDPDTGAQLARARATIWAARFNKINAEFREATGSYLASDIKVMVLASVSYHPIYGLSLNIVGVNPEYTLGDLLRRRREMIARLQAAGILNLNRELPWVQAPLRVAIISAAGAAGYGDFINQLYSNRYCLRFSTKLFQAVLQGDKTAPSIIAALEAIAAEQTMYDCVVIIRGGGATGDLAAFDNYELAANIAMFPLPVIVGIGHERDVTLLDYVANMRVKTPTAAAEWLISRAAEELERLYSTASEILAAASTSINNAQRRLEYISGQLPMLAMRQIERQQIHMGPMMADAICQATSRLITRHTDRLAALTALADSLSPEATLRRGFSVTRLNGRPITSAADVADGAVITTTLADGVISSTVHN
jgi:exodeoxyribonuclease VII large subunit